MLDSQTLAMMAEGTGATLYMTLMSTLFGYILGLPMGIILVVTAPKGLRPNQVVYRILDVIVNITRSIPFLIFNDPDYAVYPYSGRQNLWNHSDHRTACPCSSTVYCAYGGILPSGSGSRSN